MATVRLARSPATAKDTASQPPHDRAVLLFYEGLIILSIDPGTSESDLLSLTVTKHLIVDELAAVIRVQSQQRNREPPTQGVQGTDHVGFATP